jgi:hypothetical protein
MDENSIAEIVVDVAFKLHSSLGPELEVVSKISNHCHFDPDVFLSGEKSQ